MTPGSFETRETGVILNVTPTVGPDGYTIELVLAPEVADLVDWLDYGSTVGGGSISDPSTCIRKPQCDNQYCDLGRSNGGHGRTDNRALDYRE